jgi:hypothetical protein
MGKIRSIAILGLTGLLVAGGAIHNVGTDVTEEDVYLWLTDSRTGWL